MLASVASPPCELKGRFIYIYVTDRHCKYRNVIRANNALHSTSILMDVEETRVGYKDRRVMSVGAALSHIDVICSAYQDCVSLYGWYAFGTHSCY